MSAHAEPAHDHAPSHTPVKKSFIEEWKEGKTGFFGLLEKRSGVKLFEAPQLKEMLPDFHPIQSTRNKIQGLFGKATGFIEKIKSTLSGGSHGSHGGH